MTKEREILEDSCKLYGWNFTVNEYPETGTVGDFFISLDLEGAQDCKNVINFWIPSELKGAELAAYLRDVFEAYNDENYAIELYGRLKLSLRTALFMAETVEDYLCELCVNASNRILAECAE